MVSYKGKRWGADIERFRGNLLPFPSISLNTALGNRVLFWDVINEECFLQRQDVGADIEGFGGNFLTFPSISLNINLQREIGYHFGM